MNALSRPHDGAKVIFVSFVKRAEHFEKRFFVREFSDSGMHIELWDLSLIFGTRGNDDGRQEPAYVRLFTRRSEVAAAVAANTGARFVMLFALEYRFLWIYRLLTRHRCTLEFFSWGAFPAYGSGTKSLRWPAVSGLGRLYRGGMLRASRLLKLVKPFDVVFFAGSRAKEIAPGASHYIPVNLPDFEEYCDLQSGGERTQTEDLPEAGYVLFLDCYLPFHPDFRINGLEPIDAEIYRIAINRFFDQVERERGMPVVIAAHPKSDYPAGYFGTRALIKRETARLVMRSSLVISHFSTSTTYAALWQKPVVFIYSDDLARIEGAAYLVQITAALAKALDMPLYNIDHAPPGVTVQRVQKEIYDKYRMNYVTTHPSCAYRNRDILLRAWSSPATALHEACRPGSAP